MTLNQEFRDAILANNYRKCVFNPNEEGTEVCHILANSKANVKKEGVLIEAGKRKCKITNITSMVLSINKNIQWSLF